MPVLVPVPWYVKHLCAQLLPWYRYSIHRNSYSILLAATVAAGTVDEFSVVEPLAESMSQMPTGLRQRKGLACASTESDDRAPVSNEVTERHPSASGSRAPDSLETYTVRS